MSHDCKGLCSRRHFMRANTMGLGGMALAWLLKQDNLLAGPVKPDLEPKTFDLLPKKPHFEAKAKAMISLPASKGFGIGSGFAGTLMTGSAHNDPFVPGAGGRPHTPTNRSGGVQGGISNGAPIVIRLHPVQPSNPPPSVWSTASNRAGSMSRHAVSNARAIG